MQMGLIKTKRMKRIRWTVVSLHRVKIRINKRVRSPHKELLPITPPKKRVRKFKLTGKHPNPSEHVPPRFRTTRHIHTGKHINHSTRKKKNKICIDCKDAVVELCWICGKEEHVC